MYICICVCISIFVFVFCICCKQEISGCLSPGLLLHCDWAGSLDMQAAVIYICKGVFRICVFCISYLYLQDRLSLTGLDGRQSLCASSSGVYLYRCLCISYLSLYLLFLFALSMIGGCLSLGWIAAKAFVQAAPVVLTRQSRSHRIMELSSVAVEVAPRQQHSLTVINGSMRQTSESERLRMRPGESRNDSCQRQTCEESLRFVSH